MGDNHAMWFGILGTTEVTLADGSPVPVGGPRVRSLLALLLLEPGKVVTVERLIDGLYGESPPAGAANALQSQVSRLRRSLGGGLVEFHPAGYRLAVEPDDVDVHRFERFTAEGRRALAAGDRTGAAELLREGLKLWRGEALADVADAPFADAQVARLDELRAAATEDLAEAELTLGRHRDLVDELQRLVTRHPLRERARAQLMRALYGAGRQAEALAVFEDTRRTLAEELGADPSPELAAAHLAVLQGAPEPTSAPALPRLPAQLTTFVGRDEELGRVGVLLRDQRLLTLIGPGGAGKTRLAVEAAARETGEVCFVDLAPIGDGAELPNALLGALGLRDSSLLPTPGEPHADPVDRLVRALAQRPVLLILDNCEHVVDDAARLVHRLLGACPGLRVLATSREALGITGESLWPLPPLALPPEGVSSAREALGYPAVRLFADRAAAVRPGFTVDSADLDHVLRICRDLDGLPLAIELAAARLRTLSPAEVASRLDDRFRLLSRGNRTAAPRHQTLRAVVEWSWELLDEEERTLARRLTVFTGGVTLESAARVCGLPEDDVDELLAGLVDKSLLHRDATSEGRYRMLDTIQVFCAERLAEAGEHDRLLHSHAEHFFELARAADPHLRRGGQLDWLARLTAEHANLHAALRRCITRDPALALRMVAALSWYWWLRGRVEGAPLAAELLSALGPEPPDASADLGEEWVLCVANAASGDGDHPRMAPYLDHAEAIMRSTDRPMRWPAGIVFWAILAGPKRIDLERHRAQVGTDPWSRALSRMGDGFQHQFGGEMAEAEPYFVAAYEGFKAIGDRWGMANSLDPLAELAEWRGDRERSFALVGEALELVEQLGAHEERADLLARRAAGLVRDGRYAAAEADYRLAAEIARRAGAGEKADGMHHGLGEIARLRGDLPEARRRYENALSATSGTWFVTSWTRSQSLVGLGWIHAAEGDAERARALHLEGVRLAIEYDNYMYAANGADGLAGVAVLEGDGERAALLLGVAGVLRGMRSYSNADIVRVTERARELVGDEAFEAALARGRSMDREAALAFVAV
ncbi:BTAD domain-containing putative transcriptional regulator [Thermomonospora umbrina]|nr:BTAD domain-containing putative transcriptional regulator [Thermomonospora umbrina]